MKSHDRKLICFLLVLLVAVSALFANDQVKTVGAKAKAVDATAEASNVVSPLPTRGICAHRGNDGIHPENTLPAWANAVKLGAEMVEFDVKRCKTGELVIMHDPTVDRTTNGKGSVTDMTFAELRSLKANYRKGKPIPNCPEVGIPTFEEALDVIPSTSNVWINCHCAPNTAVEVAQIIQAKGRLKQAFIATSLKAIAQARQAVPEILTCNMSRPSGTSYDHPWPAEKSTQYARETVENKCNFIQLLQPCSREDIEFLHQNGVTVSYFKCDQPKRIQELVDLGVDFILTDNLLPVRAAFYR